MWRPPPWPKLSIIVPACNEADTLEAATRAKLDCDYPNLELVLVDDRSTDDTGKIADRLAESDPRVRVVHVRELPGGWLGKVHALHQGVLASSGEWLLFSDADVHLSRTLLRRVVALAESREKDFVALMPQLLSSGFWIDVCLTSFCRQIGVMSRAWRVEDPKSKSFAGGGVFALVRRSAYERTKGLEWLRLEVADDVALAQLMKRSGLRCAVYNGREDVRLHYYRSVRELYYGMEKNGAAVLGRYNLLRHFAFVGVLCWLELGPALALLAPWWSARIAGTVGVAAAVVSQVIIARWTRRPTISALVPIVGPLVLFFVLTRSAVLAAVRGAITWRGTRYSVKDLREGSRLELP